MKTVFLLLLLIPLSFQSIGQQTINLDWEEQLSDVGFVFDIKADNHGNVYAVGYFQTNFSFQGLYYTCLPDVYNGYLLKLDPSGTLLWGRHFSSKNENRVLDVDLDASNYVYVLGEYQDTLLFDTTLVTNNALPHRAHNTFLAKYDENGQFIWADSYGGIGKEHPHVLAIDQNNDILMSGTSIDLTLFGADTMVHTFDSAMVYDPVTNMTEKVYYQDEYTYLAKYASDGQQKWIKTIATDTGGLYSPINYKPEALLAKENNSLVITGNFWVWGQAFFDGIAVERTGTETAFIVQTDSLGAVQWAHTMGGSHNHNVGTAITVDSLGNVYQTGYLGGNYISLNDSVINASFSSLGRYFFLAKYNDSGVVEWLKYIDDPALTTNTSGGTAIAVLNSHLLIYGTYQNNFPLCSPSLTANSWGTFLLEVDFDGGITTCYNSTTIGGGDMSVNAMGEVYLTGYNYSASKSFIAKLGLLNSINYLNEEIVAFDIYPNPSSGLLNLEFEEKEIEEKDIFLYSASGQLLANYNSLESSLTIETTYKGLLFVVVQSDGKMSSRKVVLH